MCEVMDDLMIKHKGLAMTECAVLSMADGMPS